MAEKKINAFSGVGHGFYFWNFRTDLEEPQWSYMLALDRGWIPNGNLHEERIEDACKNEDEGHFKCILKRDIPDQPIRDAIHYINDQTNNTENRDIEALSGDKLRSGAEPIIDEYFQDYRASGVTCDFGGIGLLVEENRNITDDDYLGWDDDEYYIYINTGPSWWLITIYILVATLLGSLVGFMSAMRFSKKFNKRVRESKFFKNTSFGKNPLVRKSLALPSLHESFGELEKLYEQDDADKKNSKYT